MTEEDYIREEIATREDEGFHHLVDFAVVFDQETGHCYTKWLDESIIDSDRHCEDTDWQDYVNEFGS